MPVKKKTTKKVEEVAVVEPVIRQGMSARGVVVPFLVGVIIIMTFGVGLMLGQTVSLCNNLVGKTNTAEAQPVEAKPQQAITIDGVRALFNDKTNITFGDVNSKVLFVEFSDPSCPYCHIASGKNPELNKQTGTKFALVQDGGSYLAPVVEMKKLVDSGKAAFAWVYSPGHGNGELATQVLYCAKEQNKFWEVHDLLMSNVGYDLLNETVQNDITQVGKLTNLVAKVANAPQLKTCVESKKFASRVSQDTALATAFGVRGTPSFFVNEKNFPGAYNFSDMKSFVDGALK